MRVARVSGTSDSPSCAFQFLVHQQVSYRVPFNTLEPTLVVQSLAEEDLRRTWEADWHCRECPLRANIKVRGQVGECICRTARCAILRPSKNPDRFLSGPDEDPDYQELGFSKNCVSLEISGLELTDPSFCDLPGTLLPLFPIRPELNVFGKGLIASVGQGGKTSDIDLCTSQAPIFRGREFPLSRCGTCRPRACAEDVQGQALASHCEPKSAHVPSRTCWLLRAWFSVNHLYRNLSAFRIFYHLRRGTQKSTHPTYSLPTCGYSRHQEQ